MTGFVCYAKDFRFYPEGDGEPLLIVLNFQTNTLEQWMEARIEAGRCARRVLQSRYSG